MKKQSPVREMGVCRHTRNCTTAYPFPGGGRFACFPGAATKSWSAGPFCLLLRKTCPPRKQTRCHQSRPQRSDPHTPRDRLWWSGDAVQPFVDFCPPEGQVPCCGDRSEEHTS